MSPTAPAGPAPSTRPCSSASSPASGGGLIWTSPGPHGPPPTTARSRRERRGSVPPCCSAGSLVTRWPVTRWPAMRWLAMRRVLLRLVLASPLDRGELAVDAVHHRIPAHAAEQRDARRATSRADLHHRSGVDGGRDEAQRRPPGRPYWLRAANLRRASPGRHQRLIFGEVFLDVGEAGLCAHGCCLPVHA